MWTDENRARYDRSQLRYPSDLTDDEWALVKPLIPPAKHGGRKRSVDERAVVNGIMYVLSTGCQWRCVPKDLPAKSTLHDYLERWNYDGTLDNIHHALYVKCREQLGREASPTACVLDSQSVKSAEKGGPALIPLVMMQARVRLEGAYHLWRKVPSGQLSIDPEADERLGWATGWVEAS
jgi:transposase